MADSTCMHPLIQEVVDEGFLDGTINPNYAQLLSRIDRFSLGPNEEGSKRGRDSSRGGRGSS